MTSINPERTFNAAADAIESVKLLCDQFLGQSTISVWSAHNAIDQLNLLVDTGVASYQALQSIMDQPTIDQLIMRRVLPLPSDTATLATDMVALRGAVMTAYAASVAASGGVCIAWDAATRTHTRSAIADKTALDAAMTALRNKAAMYVV